MGTNTDISFCHHTWSPWRGCEHARLLDGTAHPGCVNCYAELQAQSHPDVLGEWGPNSRRAIAAEKYWRLPIQWNAEAKKAGERRRVFPSLMDPFEDRPDLVPLRARMFEVIDACPWLDFLLFTKRPQNILRLWPADGLLRPNVWLLYSASNQASLADGVPALLACRPLSPVLGLSLEPLVDAIDLCHLPDPSNPALTFDCLSAKEGIGLMTPHGVTRINWIITGGESGPQARPCHLAWIRNLLAQARTTGVPAYNKQLGTQPIWSQPEPWAPERRDGYHLLTLRGPKLQHKKGGDPSEWADDLKVCDYPTGFLCV